MQCKAAPPQPSIQYPNQQTPPPQPNAQAMFSVSSDVNGFQSNLQMQHPQISSQATMQTATSGNSWDNNKWENNMGNMNGIMKPQQTPWIGSWPLDGSANGCGVGGQGAAGMSMMPSGGGIDGAGGGA